MPCFGCGRTERTRHTPNCRTRELLAGLNCWILLLVAVTLLLLLPSAFAEDPCNSTLAVRLSRREETSKFFDEIKRAKDEADKHCTKSSCQSLSAKPNPTEAFPTTSTPWLTSPGNVSDVGNNASAVVDPCRATCGGISPGSLDIVYDEFEFYAGFAIENGQLLSNLIASLPFSGTWVRGADSLANQTFCSAGGNFFSGGNALFVTRARSAAQTENVFAVGGCLGDGTLGGSECFYHHLDPTLGNDDDSAPIVSNPKSYCLKHSLADPGDPNWFVLPKQWLNNSDTAELTGNNHTWLGGECYDYCDLPYTEWKECNIPKDITCPVYTNYSSDLWVNPYFDCDLGFIWMITYAVPVSVYRNGTLHYLGMSGVDIELERISINQCSPATNSHGYSSVFANTHLCDEATSTCQPRTVQGSKLQRGLYSCVCKEGYYSDQENGTSEVAGTTLEKAVQEFNINNSITDYSCPFLAGKDCLETPGRCREQQKEAEALHNVLRAYSCKRCPNRCRNCTKGTDDCRYEATPAIINALHGINAAAVGWILFLLLYVLHKRDNGVIKSASWQFLVIILAGALLAYAGLFITTYPTKVTCNTYYWFFEVGFCLSYGSLLLKSWRIEQIFTNAKLTRRKRRLQNHDLAVYLVLMIAVLLLYLAGGTASGFVGSLEGHTNVNGQEKYYEVCAKGVFVYTTLGWHLAILLSSTYLCIKLRRVLNDYAESREISVIVYFTVLIEIIAFVADQVLTNIVPDYQYMIRSLTAMFTFTLMSFVLFFPKIRKVQWPTKEETESKSTAAGTLLRSPSGAQLKRRGTISLDLFHRDSIHDWEGRKAQDSPLASSGQPVFVQYQRRGSREALQRQSVGSFSGAFGSKRSLVSRSSTEGALRLSSTSSAETPVPSPFLRPQRSQSLAMPGGGNPLSGEQKLLKPAYMPHLLTSGGSIAEEDQSLSPQSPKSDCSSGEVVVFPTFVSIDLPPPVRRKSASDAEDITRSRRKEVVFAVPEKRYSDVQEQDEQVASPPDSLPSIRVISPVPSLMDMTTI